MERWFMKKHFSYLRLITLLLILFLDACASIAKATPTPTQESLESISTSAAKTAFFQLTQLALTQPPTPTDTNTPEMTPTASPSLLPALPSETPALPKVASCANATYVSDVSIPDGMEMVAGKVFTKIWGVTNSGHCPWTTSFRLAFSGGDAMGGTWEYLENVAVGKTVNIPIQLTVPNKTGTLTGWWVLLDDMGKPFGPPLSVVITVR
jgi:hypothetical protein